MTDVQVVETCQRCGSSAFLDGPPHQDTWDLKPEAPVEFRGEFNPLTAKTPGVQLFGPMPVFTRFADTIGGVRSVATPWGTCAR